MLTLLASAGDLVSIHMSELGTDTGEQKNAAAAALAGLCDRFAVGIVMLTLFRASEALAADSATAAVPTKPEQNLNPSTSVSASRLAIPALTDRLFTAPYDTALLHEPATGDSSVFAVPQVTESKSFPSKDFRPRGRSILDAPPVEGATGESLESDKTLWERLPEYRNQNKIRLLTLWESGMGAVSIQADHKGDPYLQWTSHLMNRGGASHGVFDHLVPKSVFSGDATRVTRSANSGRSAGVLSGLHLGESTPP
jgi:hypothetical protein